jgi:hypothetical protein
VEVSDHLQRNPRQSPHATGGTSETTERPWLITPPRPQHDDLQRRDRERPARRHARSRCRSWLFLSSLRALQFSCFLFVAKSRSVAVFSSLVHLFPATLASVAVFFSCSLFGLSFCPGLLCSSLKTNVGDPHCHHPHVESCFFSVTATFQNSHSPTVDIQYDCLAFGAVWRPACIDEIQDWARQSD